MTPEQTVKDSREDAVHPETVDVSALPRLLQQRPHVRAHDVNHLATLDRIQLHQPVRRNPRLVELPVLMQLVNGRDSRLIHGLFKLNDKIAVK